MDFSVNQNLLKKVDGVRKMLAWSLLPPNCLLCQQPGMGAIDLCAACWHELPINPLACSHCALPLSAPAPACAECLKHPPPFTRTLAPLQYLAPISSLVPRFKFHQDLAAGRLLASLFCQQLGDVDRPDAIVPVPLHVARLRQRGFDQALELAKLIARHQAIALRADLLLRKRNTVAQSYLNAVERRKNCRGAFVVSAKAMPEHIALVDDVMTTGATVRECAKQLLQAGAKRVDIWVIARVASP